MSETFLLRYVRHEDRPAYEVLGWECAGNGQRMGHHGYWSCLMRWSGEGEPRTPEMERAG
ncbi:MAG: hypothetical protein AB7P35_17815 [Hyphomonadaceae bacterium]